MKEKSKNVIANSFSTIHQWLINRAVVADYKLFNTLIMVLLITGVICNMVEATSLDYLSQSQANGRQTSHESSHRDDKVTSLANDCPVVCNCLDQYFDCKNKFLTKVPNLPNYVQTL